MIAPDPIGHAANKAATHASRIDFWLLAASSSEMAAERRQDALTRAFRQFVGLLAYMRELKALEPALYAAAEAEALNAREIEGRVA